MARRISRRLTWPERYSTVTRSAAKFTDAERTPDRAPNPPSILATHEAQDIPRTGMVAVSAGTSYPWSRTAFTRAVGVAPSPYRTVARSVARFTVASVTPLDSPRADSIFSTHT